MVIKTYQIEITETLQRVVELKAKSGEDAYAKVKKMYDDEEIVLDNSDYIDTDIKKMKNG